MRLILAFLLTVVSAGIAQAQNTPPVVDQNNERLQRLQRESMLKAVATAQEMERLVSLRQAERNMGATLKADKIILNRDPVSLQGNVTITFMNGVVITADDAVFENGEIRLGSNARVRVPQQ